MDLSPIIRPLRKIVPLALRRQIASLKRARRDKREAHDFASTRSPEVPADWVLGVSITQPLIAAPHLDEKRANLAKAIALTNGLVIAPNQTLSVWHCLGPPTTGRGWASGRTIINDVMTTDPGGGPCQFSSLIYHLGLLAGLTVIERHHHSRDIHLTDATRFTPLGLDAAIVHGFKDLRLRNDGVGDLVLTFELEETSLSGTIWGSQPLLPRSLDILRHESDASRRVVVSYVEGDGLVAVSDDVYNL
jgi:vancomycin resistance protein VanW